MLTFPTTISNPRPGDYSFIQQSPEVAVVTSGGYVSGRRFAERGAKIFNASYTLTRIDYGNFLDFYESTFEQQLPFRINLFVGSRRVEMVVKFLRAPLFENINYNYTRVRCTFREELT